LNGLDPNK